MKTRSNSDSLKESILVLERKQELELASIKEQLYVTYESVKPVNIIKNSLKEIISSPGLKGSILNNIVGLASGYFSRKLLLGNSHNPIKKVLGAFLQFAVTNVVTNHSEGIDSLRSKISNLITDYKAKGNN